MLTKLIRMKKTLLIFGMLLLMCGTAIAQRTITGTITDSKGETIIGASVLVKGTSLGTITDVDGKFSLNVPNGDRVLSISYTGFSAKEVPVGASNIVDVVLSEGLDLSEVVVTALGVSREKKALTTTSDKSSPSERTTSTMLEAPTGTSLAEKPV